MPIQYALLIHCLVVGLVLVLALLAAHRRGRLTLLHTGTWVLFACSLYFVFNPAAALFTGATDVYEEALLQYTREGSRRVLWMLLVIVAGIVSFFVAYLSAGRSHTPSTPPKRQIRWSTLNIACLAMAIGIGLYGILFYRTAGEFVDSSLRDSAQFDQGRIVGGVTGYVTAAHKFYIFPVVLLLFRGPTSVRRFGGLLLLGFVGLRLYDSHDRASVVSLTAAAGMALLAHRNASEGATRRRWRARDLVPFVAAALVAGVLTMRGHSSISDASLSLDGTPSAQKLAVESNTAMLPPLYARTYQFDRKGFDYAVPVLTRALFGWLPRRYFPWKDDLNETLLDQTMRRDTPADFRWIMGPKMTLVGSFYGHGGLIGVVLGMLLLGRGAVALDRLVASGSSDLRRSVGIVWMADAWMMFAGNTVGIMMRMFTTGLPCLMLYVTLKLQSRGTISVVDPKPPQAVYAAAE